jgi:hypothetical protein
MIDQLGYADEDQYNVAGDFDNSTYYDHRTYINSENDDQPYLPGYVMPAVAGVIVFLVVLAGCIAYQYARGNGPFPGRSDRWPAGVTRAMVTAATGDWLDRCQKSESREPANCPQKLDENVAKVHWALYGNPLDAAVIQYDKSESRFDVLGTFVATAEYTISHGSRRVVTPTTYWAKLHWAGGRIRKWPRRTPSRCGRPS